MCSCSHSPCAASHVEDASSRCTPHRSMHCWAATRALSTNKLADARVSLHCLNAQAGSRRFRSGLSYYKSDHASSAPAALLKAGCPAACLAGPQRQLHADVCSKQAQSLHTNRETSSLPAALGAAGRLGSLLLRPPPLVAPQVAVCERLHNNQMLCVYLWTYQLNASSNATELRADVTMWL